MEVGTDSERCRLEDEKRAWDDLLASSNVSLEPAPSTTMSSTTTTVAGFNIDPTLLNSDQTSILATLIAPETALAAHIGQQSLAAQPKAADPSVTLPQPSPSTRLRIIADSLEPTIDTFADGIHKLSQYRLAAENVADRVLGAAATMLEERDKTAKERSGTEGIGVGSVLGTLGAVLAGTERSPGLGRSQR